MCHKCRNKIRARAVDFYLNEECIPDNQRETFERGMRFGEMQAALFVEKVVSAMRADTILVLAAQEALTGERQDIEDISSLAMARELSGLLEQEGLRCLFGNVPATKDTAAKYNLLRACHELPIRLLETDPE